MNLRLRLAIEWLAIGLLATAIVVGALYWRAPAPFDNVLYDRLSAVSRPVADRQILIVAIDDASLAATGKWPWDREVHARLIEKLQAQKPRSIAFDILLSEDGVPESDARLAAAMAGGPAPVYMPLHFISPGSNGNAYDTILPAPVFASAADAAGHVNILFDDDGIVRRTNLCFRPERRDRGWPHLMELVYRGNNGAASPAAAADTGCNRGLLIPYSTRGSFAEISYSDLLNGNLPNNVVAGRDIIIGATATGMGDSFPTPNGSGGLLAGAEIMANMLGALRRDDFVEPLPTIWTFALSLAPLWLLLLGFLRWRPRVVLVMSLLTMAALLATSAGLLFYRLWFPPGAALVGVLLIYPLWGWRRLQAMSDFMGSELTELAQENGSMPLAFPQARGTDLVGRQSEALAGAIDHMRDLRRFVADTLADLPDPMFVTDPEGRVTLTNEMLDERLSRSVAGMTLTDALDLMVLPEQRDAVDRFLTEGDLEFVRFGSPAGRTFVMRRSEVRGDADILHGHIHYLADISALARAETEREQVLQLLSHDMRAPQSTIIAILDGEIDADAKKRIERNARRTMQLAQNFVDLARMAETEFAGEDVLLADLVREAADGLWPLARERGIKFAFGDSSNGAFVRAEPDSLSRAICNLVDNAIKFSPDNGTVGIAIARDNTAETPAITVTITDSGQGIADHLLPVLFRRFAGGGEQSGRVQGTGLGLHFVEAVIERHGGTISASNSPGNGAMFVVSLPEAPEA